MPDVDEALGWVPMSDADFLKSTRIFDRSFHFVRSVTPDGWPGVVMRSPSVTFGLSHAYMPTVDETGLLALLEATEPSERIAAIDYGHYGYWLLPHRFAHEERTWPDSWPVQIYPNGDYMIFLRADFSGGSFGHPWEQTLTFFGEAFVAAARHHFATLLAEVRAS